jgi:DNA-binding MarR family transcriptional regulator
MSNNHSTGSIIESNRVLNLLFYDKIEHNNTFKGASAQLTKNQYTILKTLKITGPVLVSEIAELMHFSRAAASKNVDVLVNLKLISRHVLSRDRRKAKISILMNGEKIVEEFEDIIYKKQYNSLASLSKKEQQILSELLGKYVNHCLSHKEDIELICSRCNGKIDNGCVLLEHNVKCRFSVYQSIKG